VIYSFPSRNRFAVEDIKDYSQEILPRRKKVMNSKSYVLGVYAHKHLSIP